MLSDFFSPSNLLDIAAPEIIRVKKKITNAHCAVLNVVIRNDHYMQSNVCRLRLTVALLRYPQIHLSIMSNDNYTLIIIRYATDVPLHNLVHNLEWCSISIDWLQTVTWSFFFFFDACQRNISHLVILLLIFQFIMRRHHPSLCCASSEP